jgi:hypothetical protein
MPKPADFAMPKPDTNVAEALEEADKMETDGNTPVEEVIVEMSVVYVHFYLIYV